MTNQARWIGALLIGGALAAPSQAAAKGKASEVIGVETLDIILPANMHAQGIKLPAKLVRPKWDGPAKKQPAMLVLHGSGGLLKTPKTESGKQVCLSDMEGQYEMWAERLAKRGYTVLLPSSYSARGFCDKHDDVGRMPETFDDKPEQILSRIYDTDVAARYLCSRPEVDCDRMGVMGFSQGGTMTLLALHWQLEHAVQYMRETKADEIDFEIPDLAPGRPEFQLGVAYYPGCGFDGVVPLLTDETEALANKYTPTAPLVILHGSEDPLIEECHVDHGAGRRQIQSGQVAAELGVEDDYAIEVYEGAEHGFDHGMPGKANKTARDAALAATVSALAKHLD
jgi:dienelactone hydrolase